MRLRLFNIHNNKCNYHIRTCIQQRFNSITVPLRNSPRNTAIPVHKVNNFNSNIIKSRNLVFKLIKRNSESEIGPPNKMLSISDFSSTIALILLQRPKDVKKKYSTDCQKYYEKELQTNVEVITRSYRWNSRTKSIK